MRPLLFALFAAFSLSAGAQEESAPLPNKGLLAATATFMPSVQWNTGLQNFYVHGFLEYFPGRRISLRGDIAGLVISVGDRSPLLHYHRVWAGGTFHFPVKQFDPYIGFQPGMGVVQTRYAQGGLEQKSRVNVVPVVSALIGARYFVGKYFNFFLEFRYSHARHFAPNAIYNLDEVGLSAGLGFNIDVLPRKT